MRVCGSVWLRVRVAPCACTRSRAWGAGPSPAQRSTRNRSRQASGAAAAGPEAGAGAGAGERPLLMRTHAAAAGAAACASERSGDGRSGADCFASVGRFGARLCLPQGNRGTRVRNKGCAWDSVCFPSMIPSLGTGQGPRERASGSRAGCSRAEREGPRRRRIRV